MQMHMMLKIMLIWAVLLSTLTSCGRQQETDYHPTFAVKPESGTKVYVVGIHPLHNPKRLMEIYGPIVDYMNNGNSGARLRLEAARNYEDFDKKLYAGYYDLVMPNPYQTVRALKHGYHVFAKMGDDEEFRGIILVRKDSRIREVTDLRGKVVAYPAKTALAATMLPQYYLHTHGIDVNADIENHYVGSQESSILNVLRGHAAAAATWPLPWKAFSTEFPEMASQLEVKWQTEPLLNNSWMASGNVPRPVVETFRKQLLTLHETPQGRRILARLPITRFEPAQDKDYLPVIQFLESFSNHVRKIEW